MVLSATFSLHFSRVPFQLVKQSLQSGIVRVDAAPQILDSFRQTLEGLFLPIKRGGQSDQCIVALLLDAVTLLDALLRYDILGPYQLDLMRVPPVHVEQEDTNQRDAKNQLRLLF
jgi:hypothetical protein